MKEDQPYSQMNKFNGLVRWLIAVGAITTAWFGLVHIDVSSVTFRDVFATLVGLATVLLLYPLNRRTDGWPIMGAVFLGAGIICFLALTRFILGRLVPIIGDDPPAPVAPFRDLAIKGVIYWMVGLIIARYARRSKTQDTKRKADMTFLHSK